MLEGLKSIPGFKVNEPQGAFYFFPDITGLYGKKVGDREINNSSDFCMYLIEEANVATVPGEAFGSPENFRLSYATSDDLLTEAIKRIKEAVEKLK